MGHGASMASGTPLKHGVLKHGSDNQMLMSSVHGIVHGAQGIGSAVGKKLRGDSIGDMGRNDDVRRRRMLFEMNPTVKKVDVNTPPRQPVLGLICILMSLLVAHGQSKASKALEKRIGGKHRLTTVVTIIALFVSLLFALLCVPGMHIPQDGDHTVIQGKAVVLIQKKM